MKKYKIASLFLIVMMSMSSGCLTADTIGQQAQNQQSQQQQQIPQQPAAPSYYPVYPGGYLPPGPVNPGQDSADEIYKENQHR